MPRSQLPNPVQPNISVRNPAGPAGRSAQPNTGSGLINFLTTPIGGENTGDTFRPQINPIQAIGLGLSSLSQAKRGVEPSAFRNFIANQQQNFQIQQQMDMQRQQLALRKIGAGFKGFTTGLSTLQTLPEAERERFVDKYARTLDKVNPGFGQAFRGVANSMADFVDPLKLRDSIAGLPLEAQSFIQTLIDSGRQEEAIDVVRSFLEKSALRSTKDNVITKTDAAGNVRLIRASDDGNVEVTELGRIGKPSSQFSVRQGKDGELEIVRGPSMDQERVDESFDTQQAITELGQLFRKVDEAGEGVTGLRGIGIDVLGGLAGQFSPELESAIAQGIGNVSPEQVKEFRTRARAQIAKLVPDFTGEQGARISDRELQIAEIATGLLSPTASLTQVRTAIPLVMELKISDQVRQALEVGERPPFDLATDRGINELGNRLLNFGIPQSQVEGMLRDLKEIQSDLENLNG